MAADYTIGIDLGGTNIKGGICDKSGTLVAAHSIETQAEGGFEHVLARMTALVAELLQISLLTKADIRAIGLGAAGPVSHADGLIRSAPHLPGWVNIPLRDRFADATGLPVVLENDANAAAYGEFVAGAGRGVSSMVMLTLGTGIGGGIVLDGRLWRGNDGAAAEIGHTVIVPGGRPCPCGQEGCFECYASANAVAERLIEAVQAGEASLLKTEVDAGRPLDARHVLRAADEGDALAARIWDETCHYLTLGCINIEHLLSPEMIVLGGGLSKAGDRLLDRVARRFDELRWNLTRRTLQIALATLGPEAGTIGAAALARHA